MILEQQKDLLPLTPRKLFVHGLSATVARRYGFIVVSGLESADVALIRLQAPYQTLHPNYLFGMRQHEGDLSFHEGHPGYEALRAARAARVPAIVSVYLDRAAVLTDIRDQASALFADFGASDEALLDVLIGKQSAQGRLPIELPASMDAVRAQKADAPMTARGRSTESSRVGREPARSYLEHKQAVRCGVRNYGELCGCLNVPNRGSHARAVRSGRAVGRFRRFTSLP